MEKSPIINIVKRACPAVITIVISKDLPKVEGFFTVPYGGQNVMIPQMGIKKEKTKVGGGSGFIISKNGLILTYNQEDTITYHNQRIKIIPAWQWLLTHKG